MGRWEPEIQGNHCRRRHLVLTPRFDPYSATPENANSSLRMLFRHVQDVVQALSKYLHCRNLLDLATPENPIPFTSVYKYRWVKVIL